MNEEVNKQEDSAEQPSPKRREFLKSAGKFAVYTPPAMMLLMNPSRSWAARSACGRPKKKKHKRPVKGNNGVGNGRDPQPPGNPKPNDLSGTGPGNPGNRGGNSTPAPQFGNKGGNSKHS